MNVFCDAIRFISVSAMVFSQVTNVTDVQWRDMTLILCAESVLQLA